MLPPAANQPHAPCSSDPTGAFVLCFQFSGGDQHDFSPYLVLERPLYTPREEITQLLNREPNVSATFGIYSYGFYRPQTKLQKGNYNISLRIMTGHEI